MKTGICHVGPEAHVFEAAWLSERPEAEVSVLISKLRDEAGALAEKEAAEESIDFEKLSEHELGAILKAGQKSPEAVLAVWERLKRRHGNQQREEAQGPRTDAETSQAG